MNIMQCIFTISVAKPQRTGSRNYAVTSAVHVNAHGSYLRCLTVNRCPFMGYSFRIRQPPVTRFPSLCTALLRLGRFLGCTLPLRLRKNLRSLFRPHSTLLWAHPTAALSQSNVSLVSALVNDCNRAKPPRSIRACVHPQIPPPQEIVCPFLSVQPMLSSTQQQSDTLKTRFSMLNHCGVRTATDTSLIPHETQRRLAADSMVVSSYYPSTFTDYLIPLAGVPSKDRTASKLLAIWCPVLLTSRNESTTLIHVEVQ